LEVGPCKVWVTNPHHVFRERACWASTLVLGTAVGGEARPTTEGAAQGQNTNTAVESPLVLPLAWEQTHGPRARAKANVIGVRGPANFGSPQQQQQFPQGPQAIDGASRTLGSMQDPLPPKSRKASANMSSSDFYDRSTAYCKTLQGHSFWKGEGTGMTAAEDMPRRCDLGIREALVKARRMHPDEDEAERLAAQVDPTRQRGRGGMKRETRRSAEATPGVTRSPIISASR